MSEKTSKKRVCEMQVGDVIIKHRVVDKENGKFTIDVSNKVKYEVIQPYSEDKMVVKDLETEEIRVFHTFGWIEYEVLLPKKTKGKKK
jgi:hypothetical protein